MTSADALPRGLRWREDSPVSAVLRPRISRFYFCLFGAVWNLALGPAHVPQRLGSALPIPTAFDWVGLACGLLFFMLALRELALTTHVVYGSGKLVIKAALAPWVRFDVPMSEITELITVGSAEGTYQVVAKMRAGENRTLPLGFETVPMRASWTRKRPFASPPEYASFLAGRLGEMLETARLTGHDTYRT